MKTDARRLFPIAVLFLTAILATTFLSIRPTADTAIAPYRLCGGDPVPGGHPLAYHPSNVADGSYTLCGGDPVPGGHPNGNETQG